MFGTMNGTQILLSIMIILLGVTLVIVGIQLFFVLKDLRKNLEKTSRILSDVEKISSRAVVEQQYIDDILTGLKGVVSTVSGATSQMTAVSKSFNPATMGLAVFQAVNSILRRKRREEQS
jgi:hypothetical protein